METFCIATIFSLLLLQTGTATAITIGQIDDFSDGTLLNWKMGRSTITSSHMTNITTGGPAGSGDKFIQVVSHEHEAEGDGGNRLTFFNKSQWTGDYVAAGVTSISLDLINISSSETLNLRLGINGGVSDPNDAGIFHGGQFATSTSASLLSGSGWTRVVFSLLPGDLTPVSGRSGVTGNNINATLANVLELRLLNNASPSWSGSPVTATLGVDNISAVPLPPAIALFASGLIGLGAWSRRYRLKRS